MDLTTWFASWCAIALTTLHTLTLIALDALLLVHDSRVISLLVLDCVVGVWVVASLFLFAFHKQAMAVKRVEQTYTQFDADSYPGEESGYDACVCCFFGWGAFVFVFWHILGILMFWGIAFDFHMYHSGLYIARFCAGIGPFGILAVACALAVLVYCLWEVGCWGACTKVCLLAFCPWHFVALDEGCTDTHSDTDSETGPSLP